MKGQKPLWDKGFRGFILSGRATRETARTVFKTDGGPKRPRRVRFPSASAKAAASRPRSHSETSPRDRAVNDGPRASSLRMIDCYMWNVGRLSRMMWMGVAHRVLRGVGAPGLWDREPDVGTLPHSHTAILSHPLVAHTTTPDRVWFCGWEGWGGSKFHPVERASDPEPHHSMGRTIRTAALSVRFNGAWQWRHWEDRRMPPCRRSRSSGRWPSRRSDKQVVCATWAALLANGDEGALRARSPHCGRRQ
jgi:hypothetical protein